MRQIEYLAMALSKILFNKDTSIYEVPSESQHTEKDLLYLKLVDLLFEDKINEAENLLFEKMDTDDMGYLEVAIGFFTDLNEYDDDFLEAHNYSREEIHEGLKDVISAFGVYVSI